MGQDVAQVALLVGPPALDGAALQLEDHLGPFRLCLFHQGIHTGLLQEQVHPGGVQLGIGRLFV